MFLLLINELIFPFNDKFDGLFKKTYKQNITSIECSGSISIWNRTQKKDILTKPEYAVDPDAEEYEWCSNINRTKNDHPWLLFDFRKKKFSLSGYSMKLGCCDEMGCCCIIYSWSIEGSNDNKTWTKIHQLEKQKDFRDCDSRSWETKSTPFSYIRLIQDEPHPNCWYCIGLARIELYGILSGDNIEISDVEAEDEVSIIGKVYNN